MKSIARLCLIAVTALTLATVTAQAQTPPDSSTTSTNTAPAPKPRVRGKQYKGTISSVDKDAKTITFSMVSGKTHTIHITSKTRIRKDGEPATMDDAVVGQKVRGTYRENDSKEWVASTVNIGEPKPRAASTPAPSTPPADKPAGQ